MNATSRLEKIERAMSRRQWPAPVRPAMPAEFYAQVAEELERHLYGRVVTPHDELLLWASRPAPEGPQPPTDYDELARAFDAARAFYANQQSEGNSDANT